VRVKGEEMGEQFYEEVLLPCSENLRKGLKVNGESR